MLPLVAIELRDWYSILLIGGDRLMIYTRNVIHRRRSGV
jgi:hypothetical protein